MKYFLMVAVLFSLTAYADPLDNAKAWELPVVTQKYLDEPSKILAIVGGMIALDEKCKRIEFSEIGTYMLNLVNLDFSPAELLTNDSFNYGFDTAADKLNTFGCFISKMLIKASKAGDSLLT